MWYRHASILEKYPNIFTPHTYIYITDIVYIYKWSTYIYIFHALPAQSCQGWCPLWRRRCRLPRKHLIPSKMFARVWVIPKGLLRVLDSLWTHIGTCFFLKGDVHRSDVFGTCLKEFDLNCAYFAPGKFKPKTIRQGLQSTSTCIYVCQKIFTTFNCN